MVYLMILPIVNFCAMYFPKSEILSQMNYNIHQLW